jgi:hypothetical protein
MCVARCSSACALRDFFSVDSRSHLRLHLQLHVFARKSNLRGEVLRYMRVHDMSVE